MLVASAGHIDHGKTSLVRALTGIETDRLPEERRRGISIDLGFAYWRPDDGETIGFVDVPGHERFVRNMLAGLVGIDVALIVVAADDGVMPQTVEHAQILDLIGISRGLVAISKCDRVSRERIEEVRTQVVGLLADTGLAGSPVFEVAAPTGSGVPELGEALRALRWGRLGTIAGRHFRMAVDRAFSVPGAGVVAAGTVLSGALEAGERLILSPQGLSVRARGLQSGGQAVDRVQAGQRCAINLVGAELDQISRGDWLVSPAMYAPTTRMEARLRVLGTIGKALKHHAPVHLHLGTADIGARVLVARQTPISPGGEAIVTLALEEPTSAVTGDRFVLRDQSGRQTLGGGQVVDPFMDIHRRPREAREPISAAFATADPQHALAALLSIVDFELDTGHFERAFNLEPQAADRLYSEGGAVRLSEGRLAIPMARASALRHDIAVALAEYHRASPEAEGVAPANLHAKLDRKVSAEAFQALVKSLAEEGHIERAGLLIKAKGHTGGLSAADAAAWGKVLPWLQERGVTPFTAIDVARELRISEILARALLSRKGSTGEVWRFAGDRFLLGEHVAGLVARAAQLDEFGNGFTAAEFRDATGIGRNTVIRILEFFDTIAVTSRRGDARRVRPNYQRVVGSAPPYSP
jgi:selenocysteine-specific elongation factor